MTQPASAPPVIVRRPHPDGMRGVRESADEVALRIGRDMRDPAVMKWARRTIADANLPGPRGEQDAVAVVQCLFQAIKKIVAFVKDPVGTELMVASRHLLCLDEFCVRGGDCDDQLIVLGACAMAVGVPVRLRIRRYRGQEQAHIDMLYAVDRRSMSSTGAIRSTRTWAAIDPSNDSGAPSQAKPAEEFTVDVYPGGGSDPNAGTLEFIGIGDPPPAGDLGDVAELSPAEAAGWIQQVTIGSASLAAAAARLRGQYTAYQAVRQDLGIAPFDSVPTGENAPPASLSNINYYGQSGVWTAAAETDQAKLLAAADFLSGCLADGADGGRTLTFDPTAQDVFVGSLPGDPYRVLLQVPAGGTTPVPTVLDAQGAVEGTLGILQFLIGAAVVAVVSLAAAYAVGKICDYLAQKHHDESLALISTNQANLIESGKATPEQAQALSTAMTDFAKASIVPKETGLPSFLTGWTGIAVVGVLGTALGIAIDKAIDHFTRERAA